MQCQPPSTYGCDADGGSMLAVSGDTLHALVDRVEARMAKKGAQAAARGRSALHV